MTKVEGARESNLKYIPTKTYIYLSVCAW